MKYGLLFLTVALLLAVLAISNGGWTWLAMWGAMSFGLIGLGYLSLGPTIFGKRRDGQLPLVRILVLLPFLAYVWTVWHLLRRVKRESAYDELTPGILMGRRLLGHEFPDDVRNIIDLTSEFPEPRAITQRTGYVCYPTLDATAPPLALMSEIVERSHDLDGPVYIHCAEGHGRTGLVAAALLLKRGIEETPEAAVLHVQRMRPLVRLNTSQRAALEEFAEGLLSDGSA